MATDRTSTRLVAATGLLGTGFAADSLQRAVELEPHAIGCDAGSTDPGPYYLGNDESMASRAATKRDLALMIEAGLTAASPVLLGSAGTCGTDRQVGWTLDIVEEVLREIGAERRVAAIYTEQEPHAIGQALAAGRVTPLPGAPPLDKAIAGRLVRVVAQAGPEPFVRALSEGAHVVVAGRSSDASVFAAVPLMRGCPPATAFHAAKVLECGAGSVERRLHPDCLFGWVGHDEFRVEPPNPAMRCSPKSVMAHFLYENADPLSLTEPGGTVDIAAANYEQVGRGVRVTGSRFVPAPAYTLRLEGVEFLGHRRFACGTIHDPAVLAILPEYVAGAQETIERKVAESLGIDRSRYTLTITTVPRPDLATTLRDGAHATVYLDVVGESRALSGDVAAIAWHTFLHHPVAAWTGLLSNVAYPLSPAATEAGRAYRFALNHVVAVSDPLELCRTAMFSMGPGGRRQVA